MLNDSHDVSVPVSSCPIHAPLNTQWTSIDLRSCIVIAYSYSVNHTAHICVVEIPEADDLRSTMFTPPYDCQYEQCTETHPSLCHANLGCSYVGSLTYICMHRSPFTIERGEPRSARPGEDDGGECNRLQIQNLLDGCVCGYVVPGPPTLRKITY
ncbi:hypothetical protein OH76DRAFT_909264 [Lentinus brumalis]|uniref:Uncharacterized protein n=1 Tax=Lentinus brumalis TaxID=2498619 RepID=A0A371D0J6_9APHY|nr:hypothetical protein OH76DRAFT_909264 [Polyporus brumalis]